MATFEFDKHKEEADEYAVGAARALLITQVFFQFLLCDAFEGSLPSRVDRGLKDDLASRILRLHTMSIKEKEDLVASFEQITSGSPLASYFTSSYGHLVEKLATSAGRVRTNAAVKQITKKDGRMCIEISNGDSIEADHVVFTTHPSVAGQVLNPEDFPRHTAAIHSIKSGAVGVRIIHANDLPYSYPPISNASYYAMDSPSPILGIFDISELTTTSETSQPRERKTIERREAGWMSVAYPVYEESSLNRHQKLLDSIPCADATVYPWTRATSSFPNARRHVVKLQGVDGIYMTGQSLTGVNKASELQVTNALNLCHDCFGVLPPWGRYFPCVMLTDCNDADAFYKAKSPLEASLLALKSLVGSFLLTSAVSILGVEFFD